MARPARSMLSVAPAVAILLSLPPSFARADPPLSEGQHFTVDPVSDGVVTATGAGTALLLGMVLSTGEIRPAPPAASTSMLLPIDRPAVTQTIDPNASMWSNVILWTSTGFAVLDPMLSGVRDGWDALLVDALMYAESTALTSALTDMLKIAVRRPRPYDYANPSATNTDAELSFPSGHASGVASVAATATYLAFVRSPHTARPWIMLAVGTVLTSLVGVERVRAGAHFPTDVIAGSLLGGSIGVLVPHLHRHAQEAPAVWLGVAPSPSGAGGNAFVQGYF
jgi:membrane-associated phospholipid phosphatase